MLMDTILRALKQAGRAAFKTREYAAMLGKEGYARLVLHRLKKKNEIISIRNGWWAFQDSTPEAIACEMSAPCYLSFHSALFLHGLTTQIPRKIQIAVLRKTKTYPVLDVEVKEYRVKKAQFNNFYRKDSILLASPEKAFADAINLPRTCPAFILVEALEKVNVDAVRKLLLTSAPNRRLKRLIKNAKQKRVE